MKPTTNFFVLRLILPEAYDSHVKKLVNIKFSRQICKPHFFYYNHAQRRPVTSYPQFMHSKQHLSNNSLFHQQTFSKFQTLRDVF